MTLKVHIPEDLIHWGLDLEDTKKSTAQESKGEEMDWEQEDDIDTAHPNASSKKRGWLQSGVNLGC